MLAVQENSLLPFEKMTCTNSICYKLSNLETQKLITRLFCHILSTSQDLFLNYELTNDAGKKRTPSSYERIISWVPFFSKAPHAALDRLALKRENISARNNLQSKNAEAVAMHYSCSNTSTRKTSLQSNQFLLKSDLGGGSSRGNNQKRIDRIHADNYTSLLISYRDMKRFSLWDLLHTFQKGT